MYVRLIKNRALFHSKIFVIKTQASQSSFCLSTEMSMYLQCIEDLQNLQFASVENLLALKSYCLALLKRQCKWKNGKKSIIFVLDVVIIVIVLWLFVSWNEKGRCYQKDCIIGPDGADSQFKKYTRMHLCFRDRSITFYTDMMGLHAFSHISTQRLGTQRKCLCLFSAAHTDRLCCLLFLSLLLFITFLKLGFVSKCLSNFCD